MSTEGTRSPAANAMAVLRAVARLGFGATAREICAYLQAPTATVYRILNTLVGDEYLVRTSDLRGFGLGHAATELIADIAPPVVTTAARAAIEDFRRNVRFGVHVLEFREMSIAVTDEDADHPLRARADLARALHASAAGKLLLAQLPDWREVRSLSGLTALASRTMTDPDSLDRAIDEIRSTGRSSAMDELEEGLACIAVPLGRAGARASGALCLAGATERAEALARLTDDALEAAKTIAPLLY